MYGNDRKEETWTPADELAASEDYRLLAAIKIDALIKKHSICKPRRFKASGHFFEFSEAAVIFTLSNGKNHAEVKVNIVDPLNLSVVITANGEEKELYRFSSYEDMTNRVLSVDYYDRATELIKTEEN